VRRDHASSAGHESRTAFFSFEWPSVACTIDILAWDVFFALSILFAAPVFGGCRLAASIRELMISSGMLSAAGLSGVVVGNMQVRNVGIVVYTVAFSVRAPRISCAMRSNRGVILDQPYQRRRSG
jgi:hypothetical protein